MKKMKYNQLFDIPGLKKFSDSASKLKSKDAGILLPRHLTFVSPEVLTVEYPDLVFAQLGMKVDNSGGYARQIQTIRTSGKGGFGPKGDNSGTITLTSEEGTIQVISRNTKMKWDTDEVEEAKIANINIVEKYMTFALERFNDDIDDAALIGLIDEDEGIVTTGLANNAKYITSANTTKWSAVGDADAKYDFIADEITAQHNLVNNTNQYKANICLLPTSIFLDIQNTIKNTYSDGSILSVLRKNFQDVTFLHSPKLEQITKAGASAASDHIVIFSSKPKSIAYRLPKTFTLSPIAQLGEDFMTTASYRTGGIDILEDSSGRIIMGL